MTDVQRDNNGLRLYEIYSALSDVPGWCWTEISEELREVYRRNAERLFDGMSLDE